jgi:hypothetical protein
MWFRLIHRHVLANMTPMAATSSGSITTFSNIVICVGFVVLLTSPLPRISVIVCSWDINGPKTGLFKGALLPYSCVEDAVFDFADVTGQLLLDTVGSRRTRTLKVYKNSRSLECHPPLTQARTYITLKEHSQYRP